MRKLLYISAALLFFASCSAVKQLPSDYPVLGKEYRNYKGSLRSVTYPSSEPGMSERRMYVYVPADYDSTALRYPVVYLLHGARGDEASWITQGNILPSIDSLDCGPMIYVFPNMNSYESDADYAMSRHKGALESFFEVDGVVETFFVDDAVEATDSLFRTIAEKDSRAILGLSLGGMQALHISAAWPDKFGYVGIFSAPLHSCIKHGSYSSFYKNLDANLERQFSEPPRLYSIYVGKNDVYRGTMEKFQARLSHKGHSCLIHVSEGGHQWVQWNGYAVDFIKQVF